MSWSGNPLAVDIGPGKLSVAALGVTEPTNATDDLDWSEDGGEDGKFVPIGYTDAGSTFSYSVTSEAIQVAEEIEDIGARRTGASSTLSFAMAEMTARNLLLAMNGGIAAAPTSVEPVDADDEQRVVIVLDTDAGARWLFRRCYQQGNIEISNQKAPQKRLITVEFKLEKPAVGKSWVAFPNAQGLI